MGATLVAGFTTSATASEFARNRITYTESELDIDNTGTDGDVGFNMTNGGAEIHGFSTEITSGGNTLLAGDPGRRGWQNRVHRGRIRTGMLSNHRGLPLRRRPGLGMEAGCNRALEANGLRAVSVRPTNGSKMIQMEPAGRTV